MTATVFGLTPAVRLARQLARVAPGGAPGLTVAPGVVVDTPALSYLLAGPPLAVTDAAGNHLLDWNPDGLPDVPTKVAGQFHFTSGALKKREAFLAWDLTVVDPRSVEDALYFASYKGITDIVTKYVWPWPALVVTRLCVALGLSPNMVTTVSILLSIAAIPLFMQGHFAAGLLCAWGMTFLDTVDGKLARVTVSYSKFGNLFDHIPDLVFPPVWWWSFMWGAMIAEPPEGDARLWIYFGLIMASYVVGRLCEGAFELRNGFVPFLWRPFDAGFRLVLARRNPNLLILSVAVTVGQVTAGYVALVVWCVMCAAVQVVNYAQAEIARRGGKLVSFLDAGVVDPFAPTA